MYQAIKQWRHTISESMGHGCLRALPTILALGLALPVCVDAQPRAQGRVLLTVGGENDLHASLDKPVAILMLQDGSVLIVEEKSAPYLKLVSKDGRKRQLTGRSGAGPGEFRYISAVAYERNGGTLAVFDPALRRVSFFHIADSLIFSGSSPIPFHVTGACYLSRDLWVHSDINNGASVHRIRLVNGAMSVERSLGTTAIGHELDGMPRFRSYTATGPLACDPQRQQITAAARLLGIVRVVDTRTGAQNVSHIPGFQPLTFKAEGRGLSLLQGESGVNDEVVSIRVRPSETTVFFGRADKDHPGNGEYAFAQESVVFGGVPRVITRTSTSPVDFGEGSVVCYSVAPFPKVQVLSGSRCH